MHDGGALASERGGVDCPCPTVAMRRNVAPRVPQGINPLAPVTDRSVMRVPNPVSYNSPYLTKSPSSELISPQEQRLIGGPKRASNRPKGLGYQGRKLWDSVVAEFELDSEP